jgi:outer membrane protein assembly factor BamE
LIVLQRYSMFRNCSRIFLLASSLIVLGASLSSCSTRLYKADVVQGNFVSSEQVAALRAGMPKPQVRNILGTPLLTDIFHANRWDYVFSMERAGVTSKTRRLTVYFKDDTLERWEGDTMPSEAEFVQSLDSGRKVGVVPPLVANENDLAAFSTRENTRAKTNDMVPNSTPSSVSGAKIYPPLEAQ